MSQRRGGGRSGGRDDRNVSRPTGRGLTVRVKSSNKRTVSSARWLERQLNDPYVAEAKKQGYRSRAAFKLLQLDDKFGFLKPGAPSRTTPNRKQCALSSRGRESDECCA